MLRCVRGDAVKFLVIQYGAEWCEMVRNGAHDTGNAERCDFVPFSWSVRQRLRGDSITSDATYAVL